MSSTRSSPVGFRWNDAGAPRPLRVRDIATALGDELMNAGQRRGHGRLTSLNVGPSWGHVGWYGMGRELTRDYMTRHNTCAPDTNTTLDGMRRDAPGPARGLCHGGDRRFESDRGRHSPNLRSGAGTLRIVPRGLCWGHSPKDAVLRTATSVRETLVEAGRAGDRAGAEGGPRAAHSGGGHSPLRHPHAGGHALNAGPRAGG